MSFASLEFATGFGALATSPSMVAHTAVSGFMEHPEVAEDLLTIWLEMSNLHGSFFFNYIQNQVFKSATRSAFVLQKPFNLVLLRLNSCDYLDCTTLEVMNTALERGVNPTDISAVLVPVATRLLRDYKKYEVKAISSLCLLLFDISERVLPGEISL